MAETKKAYGQMLVSKNEDGIAVVEFEGLVTSNVPLDTENQDFAGAINEIYSFLSAVGANHATAVSYDSDSNSFSLTYPDGDIKTYSLSVKNGEVTRLTYPDGSFTVFENWKI